MCFAANILCGPECKCVSCLNDGGEACIAARKMRAKALQTRPAVCTCKNSRCAKNYCECFRNGMRRASDPSEAARP